MMIWLQRKNDYYEPFYEFMQGYPVAWVIRNMESRYKERRNELAISQKLVSAIEMRKGSYPLRFHFI